MILNYWFDKKYYLSKNVDVYEAGLDPKKHFEEYGRLEGRLPNKFATLPIINTDKICKKNKFEIKTKIPLVIPTFNNPTYVQRFINQISRYQNIEIILYDNASTYPPMLSLLKNLENKFRIIWNQLNRGPEYVYQDLDFMKNLPELFLLSDPDLDLNPTLPLDFYNTFYALTEFYKIGKAGSALHLPNNAKTNQKLKHIGVETTAVEYENQYWINKIGFVKKDMSPIYGAAIGATLCLINRNYLTISNHWKKGVRVTGNYEVKHLPWELDFELPKHEKEFYKSVQKFSFYTPKNHN